MRLLVASIATLLQLLVSAENTRISDLTRTGAKKSHEMRNLRMMMGKKSGKGKGWGKGKGMSKGKGKGYYYDDYYVDDHYYDDLYYHDDHVDDHLVPNPLPTPYFALLNGAQTVNFCETMALGNAIATYDGGFVCIDLSYSSLSSNETAASISGPAFVGEDADMLVELTMGPHKNDCFEVNEEILMYMDLGLLYVMIASESCPDGELRGQILPA